MEFLILGPLEVLDNGRAVPIAGHKQRALLGSLVLRANEVVSADQLINDLWGEHPPPTAAKTLHAHISRLRRSLSGQDDAPEPPEGPLETRGGGYVLRIEAGRIDAVRFRSLLDSSRRSLADGHPDAAARAADEALALWRGPALADFAYDAFAQTEIARLDEARVAAQEERIEAALALGRHRELVGELEQLVAANELRERLRGQLMLALYRSGRHAEALAEYERLRRKLDEDLGLQPSAELRQLSLQMVRQDPALRWDPQVEDGSPPPATAPTAEASSERPVVRRRRVALITAALAAVALATAALVLIAGHDDTSAQGLSMRVALVIPRDPAASPQDATLTSIGDALHRAEQEYGVQAETIVADESDDASVASMLQRLRDERYGLVLVFGGLTEAFPDFVRDAPSTRFVFFDAGVDLPNATTLVFADDEAGYLAGYLSGLVEASDAPRLNPQHVVSMIGGARDAVSVKQLLDGFATGVHEALPDATVLRDYTQEFADPSPCEEVANRQISAGADIVFAAAGQCSLGALSAAAIRRVWAVGVDGDQSYLGDHVLVSTVKRYDQALIHAVRSYSEGTLPSGTVRLGLRDEAVGIVGIGAGVPESIRSRVASRAEELRRGAGSGGSTEPTSSSAAGR